MRTGEELLDVADRVLAACKADQAEAVVVAKRSALTRFANNVIHQNVAETNLSVSVRAVVGKRLGVASSNDTSPNSLRELARRAAELARLSEETADFVSLPAPQPGGEVAGPAPATVNSTPRQRAEAVGRIIELAAERSLTAAGASGA